MVLRMLLITLQEGFQLRPEVDAEPAAAQVLRLGSAPSGFVFTPVFGQLPSTSPAPLGLGLCGEQSPSLAKHLQAPRSEITVRKRMRRQEDEE